MDSSEIKGAVVSFKRAPSKQLMPKGIRVRSVAPGPIPTPLRVASRPAEEMEGPEQEQSELKRPGKPSELALRFVFLAGKDSELYYGQVLNAYPVGVLLVAMRASTRPEDVKMTYSHSYVRLIDELLGARRLRSCCRSQAYGSAVSLTENPRSKSAYDACPVEMLITPRICAIA